MKRMLINATQPEELRVAIVDGQKLINLDIEVPSREQKKANIYKGVITRVEPSLEAAFVDFGAERHGFLPFKEINRRYLPDDIETNDNGRPNVKDGIKEGQELIIQVEKEERGNKGAAITTNISLAGRYLVAMPHSPRSGGVSRRIEGEERAQVREAMQDMTIPDGTGVIVRTAGVGRTSEELQWDFDYLAQIWEAIEKAAESRQGPFLIYQESNVIIRALRDHYRDDIGEILIDEAGIHKQANDFMSLAMQNDLRKLKFYEDSVPLFNRYQIESQIESAFQREVRLPSGGSIVVDPTEALTSIDINSARATKGSNIDETALNTNLEAADEIARQLRLRDLGGLVVIDFIDMGSNKHQREVENRLRDAVRIDRARVQTNRISKFGLLEMSRQRLRPSLGESSKEVCPRCEGHGTIRSIESLALAVLRIMEEEALKENTGRVIAQLPVDVATFMLNEKRQQVAELENRNSIDLLIVPNKALETPHYVVERVRLSDKEANAKRTSYEQATVAEESYVPELRSDKTPVEEPAVQTVAPVAPPQVEQKPKKKEAAPLGLLARLIQWLFGNQDKRPSKGQKGKQQRNNNRGGGRNNNRGGRNNNRNRNNRNQNNNDKKNKQRSDNRSGGGRQQNKGKSDNKNDNRQSKGNNNSDNGDQNKDNNSQNGNNRNNRGSRGGRGRGGRGRGGNRNNDNRNQNSNRNADNKEQNNGNDANNGPSKNSQARNSEPKNQDPKKSDNRAQQSDKNSNETNSSRKPRQNDRSGSSDHQASISTRHSKVTKDDKPSVAKQPQEAEQMRSDQKSISQTGVTNTSVLAYAEKKKASQQQTAKAEQANSGDSANAKPADAKSAPPSKSEKPAAQDTPQAASKPEDKKPVESTTPQSEPKPSTQDKQAQSPTESAEPKKDQTPPKGEEKAPSKD
ncbi:ribonuclease E [gamma proteobacterium HTCC5015]|nr:ribonuclease E [gamma proteobacterium HTCC5015]